MLLTGSGLTVCNKGIVPGDTFEERMRLLTPSNPSLGELLAAVPARVNDLLGTAVRVVRERFGGKVSYASLPIERVDWTPFDVIATDAGYRSVETADRYADNVRALVAQGKPVAITEFGCCTYKGAADRGGGGTDIVEWDAATVTGSGWTATTPGTRRSRPATCARSWTAASAAPTRHGLGAQAAFAALADCYRG